MHVFFSNQQYDGWFRSNLSSLQPALTFSHPLDLILFCRLKSGDELIERGNWSCKCAPNRWGQILFTFMDWDVNWPSVSYLVMNMLQLEAFVWHETHLHPRNFHKDFLSKLGKLTKWSFNSRHLNEGNPKGNCLGAPKNLGSHSIDCSWVLMKLKLSRIYHIQLLSWGSDVWNEEMCCLKTGSENNKEQIFRQLWSCWIPKIEEMLPKGSDSIFWLPKVGFF